MESENTIPKNTNRKVENKKKKGFLRPKPKECPSFHKMEINPV